MIQDSALTGGDTLSYDFVAETSALTITGDGSPLPYYPAEGTTPPEGAHWVAVCIPVPEGVNTSDVSASINDKGMHRPVL